MISTLKVKTQTYSSKNKLSKVNLPLEKAWASHSRHKSKRKRNRLQYLYQTTWTENKRKQPTIHTFWTSFVNQTSKKTQPNLKITNVEFLIVNGRQKWTKYMGVRIELLLRKNLLTGPQNWKWKVSKYTKRRTVIQSIGKLRHTLNQTISTPSPPQMKKCFWCSSRNKKYKIRKSLF